MLTQCTKLLSPSQQQDSGSSEVQVWHHTLRSNPICSQMNCDMTTVSSPSTNAREWGSDYFWCLVTGVNDAQKQALHGTLSVSQPITPYTPFNMILSEPAVFLDLMSISVLQHPTFTVQNCKCQRSKRHLWMAALHLKPFKILSVDMATCQC